VNYYNHILLKKSQTRKILENDVLELMVV